MHQGNEGAAFYASTPGVRELGLGLQDVARKNWKVYKSAQPDL